MTNDMYFYSPGRHDLDAAFPARVIHGRTLRTERADCIAGVPHMTHTIHTYIASPFLLSSSMEAIGQLETIRRRN